MNARPFNVLDVPIETAPFDEVLSRLVSAPDRGERLQLHFATAHSLVMAARAPAVGDALRSGLVQPDGMPLVWIGRLRGRRMDRVCGPDVMPALIDAGQRYGRKHYLYGSTQPLLSRLNRRLRRLYPDADIVGSYAPPFRALTSAEEQRDVERINASKADYVWVGLGAPRQDLWIATNRSRLTASVVLAVGAAFDFHAGTKRRAPRWMRRSGIEWLFRLASEPRRLLWRYTITNAAFVVLVAREELRRRLGNES